MVLLLENLPKELDPALEGPDGVEPREGRRKPHGGNARQGQLPCVGCRLHPVEACAFSFTLGYDVLSDAVHSGRLASIGSDDRA